LDLKVGIVGSGWAAANRHIPAFKKDSRVKIVGVENPNIQEAKRLARKFHVPNFFGSLREMLDYGVDIVSVCTPPYTHAELSIEAMEGGCHVLVEKPMAMNKSEAETMIEVAKRMNVKLCVVHNFLFTKSISKIIEMMESGRLGEPLGVIAFQVTNMRRRLPRWYPSLPGGLFFDEAPHMIYIMRKFLGEFDHIRSEAVKAREPAPQPVDRVNSTFGAGEKIGILNMFFNGPRDEWNVSIIGSKALAHVDLFRDTMVLQGLGKTHSSFEVFFDTVNTIAQQIHQLASSSLRWGLGRLSFGQDELVNNFIDSIVYDVPTPMDAEEGKKTLEVIEKIVEQCNLEPGIALESDADSR
jgi:predicted dehydrogenase